MMSIPVRSCKDKEQEDPVKLFKVVTNFSPGGTEGQVHNLARCLDRSRFELGFGCLKKWGVYVDEVEQWGIPIKEFPINSLYKPNTFFQLVRLALYLRRSRTQIMHSYNFYANVLAIPAARLAGVPVVLASIRDRGVYLNAMQTRLQKLVCSMADRILVNADSIREWLLEQGYDEDKIVVLKNGIDLRLYRKEKSYRIHDEFSIPRESRIVIMLARLNPQKGIDEFLRAAAIIKQKHPDVRFLVVGEKLEFRNGLIEQDVEYHRELQQRCVDMGIERDVIFAGHRSDVPDLLNEVSISVLPSHSEGLSNTLLESMAAGVPIVATRVGGNSELVRDGLNGILVSPRNPVELAEGINRILEDRELAESFRRYSLKLAEECFCMERMVKRTEELYISEFLNSARSGHQQTEGNALK